MSSNNNDELIGNGGSLLELIDPINKLDAYGKARVSSSKTIFHADERFTVYETKKWSSVIVGNAANTHDNNKKSRILSVLGNGDSVERRTRRYIPYIKGNSQIVSLSGNFKGAIDQSIKEFGQFDELNGYIFRTQNEIFQVVLRSNITGAITERVVSQANFNVDKLDGSGPSKVTIDLTKQNNFFIDYGFLGGAGIVLSIYSNRKMTPFHIFESSNIIDTLYSQQSTLPIAAKIVSTGANTTMELSCYSVATEGDDNLLAEVRSLDTGVVAFGINATPQIVAAIRLNPNTSRASILPREFEVTVQSGNKDIYWSVVFNPNIVNGIWSDVDQSIAQGLDTYDSFAGGLTVKTGYINVGAFKVASILASDIFLGRDIIGESDVVALVARTFASTGNILFSGQWKEET